MKHRFAFVALFLLLPVVGQAEPPHAAALVREGRVAEKKQDYETAEKIFRPLAEAGNAEAEFELGWLYETGHGLPQDYRLAFSWLKKAALQGQPRAEQDVGALYAAGQSVKQNVEEAAFWEALASRKPGAPWPSLKGVEDGVVDQLSPEQITAVKKRLANWKPIDPAKALPADPPDGQRPVASKP